MIDYLATWGISEETFRLLILPLLIFFARIMDVSINTVRIIYMLNGKRLISTILGFFESLIWLLAIGQIFQNINSGITYFAYAGGFASGILVGMFIEERLALGTVLVRVIIQDAVVELSDFLNANKFRYTVVEGQSASSKVNVLFSVIKRSRLDGVLSKINAIDPQAFYTVEGIKRISEEDLGLDPPGGGWFRRLRKH